MPGDGKKLGTRRLCRARFGSAGRSVGLRPAATS